MHLVGLYVADMMAENSAAQHAGPPLGAIRAFILHPGRTPQSDVLVIDHGSPA